MASICLPAPILAKSLFIGEFLTLFRDICEAAAKQKPLKEIEFIFSIPQICVSPDEQNYDIDSPINQTKNPAVATFKNSLAKPIQVFSVTENGKKQQIQSLAFFKNCLIVGTNTGRITGYAWYKNRLTKKTWEAFLANQNMTDQNDMNCFWLHKNDAVLYVGCGDNNIHAVSLDTGKVMRNFTGHSDYVHWIDSTGNRSLYSASEDGSIKFWDKREKRFVNQLEPYKNDRLERPQYGKWQGTVSVTDDWLLCGGGPKPCLYHLRSLECSTIFDGNSTVHVSGFLDDIVYLGGDNNHLFQYNLKGDITSEIPVSSSSIYSVVSQNAPEKFMSIAGASNYLDICTNFNYKDIMLKLYEAPSLSITE